MIGSIFSLAIKAILLNKARSFLTMLGVIIGVSSVVMLTGIGTGLQQYVSDQFAALGTNTLYIVPGDPFGEGGGFGNQEQAMIETTRAVLKREQLERILRNHRDLIIDGTANSVAVAEARFGNSTQKATLYGVMASFSKIQNFNTEIGRWFTENEEESARRVVVLGTGIADELFGNVDPVGKQIKLNGQNYSVLGVLEEKGGGFGGPSFDNYIYVPLETSFEHLDAAFIESMQVEVRSQDDLVAATAAIENTLLRDLDEDEFSVFDQTQLLDTINQILGALTAGLGGIAAISLLVGGIGIMNIMLVSVTERTREIGLRKALGATPNMILLQFLIEAALLSVIGGLIGLIIAFIGVQLLQGFFPAAITPEAVIMAFGVSTIVGLVFGAAPARRASKLSPIEALRYE